MTVDESWPLSHYLPCSVFAAYLPPVTVKKKRHVGMEREMEQEGKRNDREREKERERKIE